MTQPDPPDADAPRRFVFPKWANYVLPAVVIIVLLGLPYQLLLVGLGANPTTLNVGYQPEQPIPYSHELHVTELGMDCRYCHSTVEDASFAAIPSTETCMNCHHAIRRNDSNGNPNENLEVLFESFQSGDPVEWKKVHDLPDYAYFNHSAHVNKGVSCVSCHGRVDRMDEQGVFQVESMSMGWCLDCHRDPAPNLRPVEEVTNLLWGLELDEEERLEIGREQAEKVDIPSRRQMQDCSTCHR